MACEKCKWNNPVPVAVGIVPYKDGIVLVKRRFDPRAGFFALPGGFVNEREHPESAAIREVKEETGLDVQNPALLKIHLSEERNQLVFFYIFNKVSGQLLAGDDALECVKVQPEAALTDYEIAFDSHKNAIKLFLMS